MLETLPNKSILFPALLLSSLLFTSSANCLDNFSLFFISDFTVTEVNRDLLLVLTSAKVGAAVVAVILGRKIGLKMLLLLGMYHLLTGGKF